MCDRECHSHKRCKFWYQQVDRNRKECIYEADQITGVCKESINSAIGGWRVGRVGGGGGGGGATDHY